MSARLPAVTERTAMKMRIVLLFCLSLIAGSPHAATAAVDVADAVADRMVVLVRHAEKSALPADDPELSAEGVARAEALARALAHADVGAIITSEWRRTQATAAPLAKQRAITVEVAGAKLKALDAHAHSVADAVHRQRADVVLVVGHSNTVPAIIKALGGPDVGAIGEDEFGNLFVLQIHGKQVRLLRAHY